MAWRPAHAPPAEARPSGRDGRRPARRGGGRRSARPDRRRRRGGRRGRAGAGCSATRLRPSISSRSIPSWRGSPRAMRRATGFRRARASCGSTRSTRRSAARRGWLNRPVASSPTRRSSTPRRSAPLPTRAKRERMSWPRRGGRGACRLDSGLARDARARRAVCDDPPARRAWPDPRGDRKPARRAGASAGSSDDRRERASPARLGRKGLKSAAAHRAGADPARSRRPTDGGGGRASIAASGSSTGAGRLGGGLEIIPPAAVYGFGRDSIFSVA